MNIGIFTDTFEPVTNGVVDAVWRVCKGFQKEGHKVHLFALSDCNKDYVSKGVHIHKFKGKSFKFYPDFFIRLRLPLRRVMRIVKKEKIEVLHSNVNLCMGVCALIISIFKRIPLITTFHTMVPEFIECFIKSWDNDSVKKPTLIKILEKLRLRKPILWLARKFVWYWMRYFNTSEWLIVPSKYTKKVLLEHGLSKEKIIVVPNPIETGKKKKISKNKNMILHVGRLSPEKNIDILIKSLKHIKHDYNVVITSDGPQKEYLKKLAVKEGVSDRVRFTGFVSKKKLNEYYDKAELFVSAAEYDTFNNCVAEALAHGIPVIINKNSGATDFVNHGKNGLILKKNDPKEYAKNIDWLLFNKEVKKALSKAGKKIRDYTSIDNIVKKIESLYNKVNKSSKLKKLKDLIVYSAGAVFAYSILISGNIFERKK